MWILIVIIVFILSFVMFFMYLTDDIYEEQLSVALAVAAIMSIFLSMLVVVFCALIPGETTTTQYNVTVSRPYSENDSYFSISSYDSNDNTADSELCLIKYISDDDTVDTKICFMNEDGKLITLKVNSDECDIYKRIGKENKIKYTKKVTKNILGQKLRSEIKEVTIYEKK